MQIVAEKNFSFQTSTSTFGRRVGRSQGVRPRGRHGGPAALLPIINKIIIQRAGDVRHCAYDGAFAITIIVGRIVYLLSNPLEALP